MPPLGPQIILVCSSFLHPRRRSCGLCQRPLASGWGGPVGTRQEAGERAVGHSSRRTVACLLDNVHDGKPGNQGVRAAVSATPCHFHVIYVCYILLVISIKPIKFQLRSHLQKASLCYLNLLYPLPLPRTQHIT